MAREPVAIDFVGPGEERGMTSTRLAKPVPTSSVVVPEYHRLAQQVTTAAMAVQGSSNFRNWTESVNTALASPFARPSGGGGGSAAGLSWPPWVNKHAMAMRQLQSQSSGLTTAEVSDGTCLVRRDPRLESRVPTNHTQTSSSNWFEVFAQQQARKAASMYANPQQRNVSMRAPSDEACASLSDAEPSHIMSSTQTTGFGLPVPFYSTMKPESGHQQEEVNMVPAHAFERLPVSDGKQPQMAQLTIFYAGMVNVHDKVPLDKAQAIMLLAGQGSSMSSHIDSRLPTHVASPTPQKTTTTSVGPPSGANWPAPTTTGVELPQARKASLARFLERRKDRVRKGPYTNRNQEFVAQEARMRLNHPNLPTPSSPPIQRRSASPPNPSNQALVGVASSSGIACEPHFPKSPSPLREKSTSQDRVVEPTPSTPSTSGGMAVAKDETEHHPS